MFCGQCGATLLEGAVYCVSCGARVAQPPTGQAPIDFIVPPAYSFAPGEASVPPTPQPKPRRRGLAVGIGVLVLALVAGGGYLVFRAIADANRPATVMPATTIGYAQIDLDPSLPQKIAAFNFLQKIPSVKNHMSVQSIFTSDPKKTLYESLVRAVSGSGTTQPWATLNYDTDIKPWLGNKAGIGYVPSGASSTRQTPTPLIAIQVTDEQKARTTLARAFPTSYCAASKGYAVCSDNSAAGKAAVASGTSGGALASNADFNRATSALGDPGFVSLWASGALLRQFATSSYRSQSSPSLESLAPLDSVSATLSFADSAAEVRIRGTAKSDQSLPTDNVMDLLTALPADTQAAFGFTEGQRSYDAFVTAYDQLQTGTSWAKMLSSSGFTSGEIRSVLGSAAVVGVSGSSLASLAGLGGSPSLNSLNALSFSASMVTRSDGSGGDPASMWGHVKRLIDQSTSSSFSLFTTHFDSAKDGNRTAAVLSLGLSGASASAVLHPTRGTLGTKASFAKAIDTSKNASFATYLDLSWLGELADKAGSSSSMTAEQISDLKALSAVGAWARMDDARTSTGVIRLVVN